jgi:hypothetical protein
MRWFERVPAVTFSLLIDFSIANYLLAFKNTSGACHTA